MASVQHVTVTGPEAGQKLIQFLRRRLPGDVPQTALMRWIRTGQVRVDGGRAKPFQRVAEGQMVRVPPFATDVPATASATASAGPTPAEARPATAHAALTIIHETPDLLVIAKPAGLPVQPGSGHADSVATRLAALYTGAPYIPAPAHRLDKQTTGLLLAGKTFAAQARLHAAFRDRAAASGPGSGLDKRYLAWVAGRWPHAAPTLLEDHLAKDGGPGHEKVRVQQDGIGQEARCEVIRRTTIATPDGDASLLELRLLTGRTHQLRVQLASRGFPILGDRKYGGRAVPTARGTLFLHAWRITLPGGETFEAVPDWPAPFDVGGA
ncbi:MAG: RluA family pseudouridine synthase [Desulfovibrionaceae bacterium]